MLAFRLRLVLAALALASFAAAWWAAGRIGLGSAGLLVLALALCFAVPALLVLFSFVVAFAYRSVPPPELRIGPFAAAWCVVHEIFSQIAAYVFLQPFPRLALAPEPERHAGDRPAVIPAVILVHGYQCNAAVWAWFARQLDARGHDVFTLSLEPLFAPIDRYADPLARCVERVSAASGGGPVVLVGHSMGGLVCRSYVRRFGGDKVARIVTLGTPHHGSALAPFGFGADALDMRRTAEWLGGLAAFEEGGLAAPLVSIFSYHDNLVVPQTSSILAGAENVPIAGHGHLGLLFSRRVVELVAEKLAA